MQRQRHARLNQFFDPTHRDFRAMSELRTAFEHVFRDLAAHGLVENDEQLLNSMWGDFVSDYERGFDSIFPREVRS